MMSRSTSNGPIPSSGDALEEAFKVLWGPEAVPEPPYEIESMRIEPRSPGSDEEGRWELPFALDPPARQGMIGRIGPYHVSAILGNGGFGAVFRAEADDETRREVAIKVLYAEVRPNSEAYKRFCREVETMSRIQHPNLVRVYGSRIVETWAPDGVARSRMVVEMEFVSGENLRTWLDRRPNLPFADRLTLMRDVALGLQALHQYPVIHRDVKPENILLATRPGEDRPTGIKLTDFNLAVAPNGAGRITTTDAIIGSWKYMAPERFDGARSPESLLPSGDVYSLGVIFHEMLVGQYPFRTPSQIISSKRASPFRKGRPEISRAVESICLRALEKKASKRIYMTAGRLADDLDRAIKGESPHHARPYLAPWASEWIDRATEAGWKLSGKVFALLIMCACLVALALSAKWLADSTWSSLIPSKTRLKGAPVVAEIPYLEKKFLDIDSEDDFDVLRDEITSDLARVSYLRAITACKVKSRHDLGRRPCIP